MMMRMTASSQMISDYSADVDDDDDDDGFDSAASDDDDLVAALFLCYCCCLYWKPWEVNELKEKKTSFLALKYSDHQQQVDLQNPYTTTTTAAINFPETAFCIFFLTL